MTKPSRTCSMRYFIALLFPCLATKVAAAPVAPTPGDGQGFHDPASWLTVIPDNPKGEPLNVIVSSKSSASVLADPKVFFSGIGLAANNCLGIEAGKEHSANMDDGQGLKRQIAVYRPDFGGTGITCASSILGGLHFRYWSQADTGALFLSVSIEKSAIRDHDIVPDGWNLGRNELVTNATKPEGTTSRPGDTRFHSTYEEIEVPISVDQINHGIPTDGKVYVLTIREG